MATSAYDKMDRPLWLQLKEGTSAAFYVVRNSPVATYRAFGPLASLRFDLGTDRDETRGYDFRYAPTSIAVSGNLFNWAYTTDLAGNVTGISQTLPTPTVSRTYGYQEWQSYLSCAAGPWNLAAASCNPATNDPIQWTYDKVGNRLSEARDGTTDSYAYQQNAATSGNTATLDQVTLGIGGTRDYSFDAAGYLELVDLGANEIAFGFDEAGTLGTIARAVASESLSLAYDGRGFLRQADDAVTGGWLKPLYSSDGRLMSLERLPTSAGTTERINVLYFAGRPVAIWRKVGTSTATWNPIVTDHLGTPVYALTQTGAQHWLGGFEPFGRDHQQGTGQDSLTKGIFLRLPGQWDDTLLNGATLGADVYYNVHRWYEPATGRYASADPIGLRGGLNLFLYGLASPLSNADPLGLAVLICSRRAEGILGLIGNHSYFWDDRSGLPPDQPRFCGKGPSEYEDGPPTDECNPIPGSPGREDDLMGCCQALSAKSRGGWDWSPVTNDCHTQLHQCQRWLLGVEHATEAPGGRIQPPCDRCKPEEPGAPSCTGPDCPSGGW